MTNFKNIEGAVFDLDGTLVDSMKFWRRMFYDYLNAKNITPDSDIDEKTYPMTIIQAADYLNENYNLGLTRQEVIDGCNNIMAENYRHIIQLKPFVREFLDILHERNVPMYIATATDRCLVDIALKSLDIEKYFAGVVTSTEAESAKVESAKIFDMACEKIGTTKKNTIIFEDSYFAMKQAKAEGYYIAALYDEGAEAQLADTKILAHWYADTFEDYVKLMKD